MIRLKAIHKIFNQGTVNEKLALDDVNLTIRPQDFITVIGGNGAGKSTLLNVIAGSYPVEEGKIYLQGEEIQDQPDYQRAAYFSRVFQDPLMGTAADMEIEENLAMANRRGKKRGLSWRITEEERDIFYERLKSLDLGLEERMTTKVGLLSGGQRQALTLLMAILQRPQLLLLDEHTAALDPKTASRVLELTEQLVDQYQLAALMVTHNMNDAIRYGNRLIMMDEGKIIYDVEGKEKSKLKIEDLLAKFEECSTSGPSDRLLLSKH